MDVNSFDKVLHIKTLRRFRESEAREILESIAKLVRPIMCKRKWKVNTLSEFCPAKPFLLGINIGRGAEISLRIRRQDNELDFFPYNQILNTMLHELCHNDYGPHNSHFYKLWDEIREECNELMAKGIIGTGQGSDLPGICLGGFPHLPPLSSLQQNALAVSENRASDRSSITAISPLQSASMAAEWRFNSEVWCGSKSSDGGGPSEIFKDSASPSLESVQSSPLGNLPSQGGSEISTKWQCNTCTLLNQAMAVACEACGTPKYGVGVKSGVWSCKFCTLNNSIKVERCLACGEWRYSHGPSAFPPGPSSST
ncbi:hypothetical protein NMG60_11008193 [Bertholletia excelsa]